MAYAVTTPVFEGPFDLLLHLILQEEVDIHEVSLSRIVEAYLNELEKMSTLDLEIATEFLLIAATLIDLKARRLLPTGDDGELDEELALWEERDILLARLLDCKTFKDVSAVMHDLIERAELSHPRLAGPDERFETLMPDLLEGVSPVRLQRAFLRATEPKAPVSIDLFHVAPIRASVADALDELAARLPTLGRATFRELVAGITDRIEVVVRFLAILELFKQGRVDLVQAERFGEIAVEWNADAGDADIGAIDNYDG
jgi:segregation and condensation protein A